MKQEFTAYLRQLGATKPIQHRVEYFCRLCRNMLPGQSLVDIFIDEYLTEDKLRQYTGLSFYSKDCVFAVENFLTSDSVHIGPHRVVHDTVAITVEDFDFKKANDQSLMSIQLYRGVNRAGIYRASQKNCEHLVQIFLKYIKPV